MQMWPTAKVHVCDFEITVGSMYMTKQFD